ncbi:hypothetical protein EMPS_06478 [Entomortierella parvispora]|uniref:Uncharacterized protein n=1 Tax=Entomortierella parvispora TaxID=205924 RepID=A0A9P3HCP8_9FUNG|nr:hypothetical protein EMPS_06478 [Entomortierella parvispora]
MKSIFALLSTVALASLSLAAAVPAAPTATFAITKGSDASHVSPMGPGSNKFQVTAYQSNGHGLGFLVFGGRTCVCLANVVTSSLDGSNGGVIQVYGSNDCSGGFQTMDSNGHLGNAEWVNSVSFGVGGVAAGKFQNGECPIWYS